MQNFEKQNNLNNFHTNKNEIKLGANCLFSDIRGRGLGAKLKNFSKLTSFCTNSNDIAESLKTKNEEYLSLLWESSIKTTKINFYSHELSKPIFFFSISRGEEVETKFKSWFFETQRLSELEVGQLIAEGMDIAIHDAKSVARYLEVTKNTLADVGTRLFAEVYSRKGDIVEDFYDKLAMSISGKNVENFEEYLKTKFSTETIKRHKIVSKNTEKDKTSRFFKLATAETRKSFLKSVMKKGYPEVNFSKRTILSGYIAKTIANSTIKAYLQEHSGRHPLSQFKQVWKHMLTTMNSKRLERWSIKIKHTFDFSLFYKSIWRYFKFKIEGYFHKKIGARVHIWMMNVWDIFLSGIDSYWQWFKFEDQKLFALTRKGQRFLLEKREDAKLYLRAMILTLTFGGGVKLYIDKITEMVRQYRNNWAFITHSMESLRRCGNFFWFRFFLNYKVAFQGKIAGILRAERKTFKKGEVTIEDRSTVIAYHRTFPQTKFGSYSLGFWLQYRVPNLIGTFNEMEYIDTMRVLLSMYTIPWLSSRLTEIIEAIIREKEVRDQLRFNQYNRRAKGRAIIAKEINKTKRLIKLKKKNMKKLKNAKKGNN